MTCMRRYYLTRVTKEVIEPPTEATIWGNAVHTAMEHRIRDKTPLPSNMQQFEPVAQELESWSDNWVTEEKFGLTENLEPTDFMADDVWCRGILDVYTIKGKRAFVGDYKTGKMRPDLSQLKLFAAAIFHKFLHVEEIKTGFIWLNHGQKTIETFHRSDLKFIWNYFMPQLRRIENAYAKNIWPPNPSGLCRNWCPVGRAKCSHCGRD